MDPVWFLLPTGLLGGSLMGWMMQRADLCLVAMFRDYFIARLTYPLRCFACYWLLMALVVELGRWLALWPQLPWVWTGPANGAVLIGGFVFGVGMVWAGGCVFGTLYRMGNGQLLSWVAFGGILVGSALYAEIHPWWSGVGASLSWGDQVLLASHWGLAQPLLLWPLLAVMAFKVRGWWRQGKLKAMVRLPGQPSLLKALLVVGGVNLLLILLTAMPAGVTTGYTKLAATIENGIAPEHVASREYFQTRVLDYQLPFTSQQLTGTPGPGWDGIALLQWPLTAGVILGSAWARWRQGSWRLYWRMPLHQYVLVLVGGTLVGLGARLAYGCNIWYLLGELPLLTATSLLFGGGMLAGCWAGTKVLQRLWQGN